MQQIPRVIFAVSTPLVTITFFPWQVENMHLLSMATSPSCYPVTADSSGFRISRSGVGLPISCDVNPVGSTTYDQKRNFTSSPLGSGEGSRTFSIRKRKKRRQRVTTSSQQSWRPAVQTLGSFSFQGVGKVAQIDSDIPLWEGVSCSFSPVTPGSAPRALPCPSIVLLVTHEMNPGSYILLGDRQHSQPTSCLRLI